MEQIFKSPRGTTAGMAEKPLEFRVGSRNLVMSAFHEQLEHFIHDFDGKDQFFITMVPGVHIYPTIPSIPVAKDGSHVYLVRTNDPSGTAFVPLLEKERNRIFRPFDTVIAYVKPGAEGVKATAQLQIKIHGKYF